MVRVEIVSPERLILSEEAGAVSVPGSEGYFTVMGDHAALLTTLKPGFVTVGEGGDAHRYYVEGGFADVSPSGVTILADSARTAADFSPAEIEAALRKAEEALAAAEGIEDRDAAQYILDGWKNLMLEAAQTGGVTRH
jgi:F-type H+-transporting ATPase subunit epsilon